MWGMCRSQNVLSPLETPFSTLDEVFAYFASPASMWRTVVLGGCGMWAGLMMGVACGQRFARCSTNYTSTLGVYVIQRSIGRCVVSCLLPSFLFLF